MGINDLRHVAGSTLDVLDWTEDQLRLCVESEGDERATPPLNADLREALLTAIARAERIEAEANAYLAHLDLPLYDFQPYEKDTWDAAIAAYEQREQELKAALNDALKENA